MPDAVPALQCIGLSKVFRDFWLRPRAHAVRGIDLAIGRGEVLGLLGPNGSGKSTTIKMILGLLHPTAGRIAVLGRGPRDVENKRRIGYLPEESYLYRHLTPRETLDFYGKLFGLSPANRRLRTDMLLDMVGLSHAADRAVGEFSKGMQRKVGLAQALINDPEFLILDEPTSGMDPIAIHETKLIIQKLKEGGKTILLCSHQMSEVEDVCDRVVIMYGGRIRMEGSVADLLTVREETTLTLPSLPSEEETRLRALLAQNGLAPREVAHPRRSLEKLFFEVISAARGGGADTAGATAGGKFAAFLAQGREAQIEPGHSVPAKAPAMPVAVSPSAATAATQEARLAPASRPVTAVAASASVSAPPETDPLLAELLGAKKASVPAKPAAAKQAQVSAADDALAELLGDKPKAQLAPPSAGKGVKPKGGGLPAPASTDADESILKDLLG